MYYLMYFLMINCEKMSLLKFTKITKFYCICFLLIIQNPSFGMISAQSSLNLPRFIKWLNVQQLLQKQGFLYVLYRCGGIRVLSKGCLRLIVGESNGGSQFRGFTPWHVRIIWFKNGYSANIGSSSGVNGFEQYHCSYSLVLGIGEWFCGTKYEVALVASKRPKPLPSRPWPKAPWG